MEENDLLKRFGLKPITLQANATQQPSQPTEQPSEIGLVDMLKQTPELFMTGVGNLLKRSGGAMDALAQMGDPYSNSSQSLRGGAETLKNWGESINANNEYESALQNFEWDDLTSVDGWSKLPTYAVEGFLTSAPEMALTLPIGGLGAKGAVLGMKLGTKLFPKLTQIGLSKPIASKIATETIQSLGAGYAQSMAIGMLEGGDVFNQALAEGYSAEEAKEAALDVLADNIVLGVINAPQYAGLFKNRFPELWKQANRLAPKGNGILTKTGKAIGGATIQGVGEGAEETIQRGSSDAAMQNLQEGNYFTGEKKGATDKLLDPEFYTDDVGAEGVTGFATGVGMSLLGRGGRAIGRNINARKGTKSEQTTQQPQQQKVIENQPDFISGDVVTLKDGSMATVISANANGVTLTDENGDTIQDLPENLVRASPSKTKNQVIEHNGQQIQMIPAEDESGNFLVDTGKRLTEKEASKLAKGLSERFPKMQFSFRDINELNQDPFSEADFRIVASPITQSQPTETKKAKESGEAVTTDQDLPGSDSVPTQTPAQQPTSTQPTKQEAKPGSDATIIQSINEAKNGTVSSIRDAYETKSEAYYTTYMLPLENEIEKLKGSQKKADVEARKKLEEQLDNANRDWMNDNMKYLRELSNQLMADNGIDADPDEFAQYLYEELFNSPDGQINAKKTLNELAQEFAATTKEINSQVDNTEDAEFDNESKGDAKQADVYEVPTGNVNVDEARFQNRSKLDETVLKNIADNYDENQFDPVVIWNDPKDGKDYLLAGHHRLEGTKLSGRNKVKARYFKGNEQEAIDYAKRLSNANRSLEKPQERAKLYRKDRFDGKSKAEIERNAKEVEGKNATPIIDLSYLNEKGKAIQALDQFDTAESSNKRKLSDLAQWLGRARRNYPQLTDSHENQLFDYMMENEFKSMGEFTDFVNDKVGRFDFEPDKPIPLNKSKSEIEREYDNKINDLKNQIKRIQQERKKRLDELTDIQLRQKREGVQMGETDLSDNNEITKRLKKFDDEIKVLQQEVIKLQNDRGTVKEAVKSQGGLFDTMDNAEQSLDEVGFTEQEIETIKNNANVISPEEIESDGKRLQSQDDTEQSEGNTGAEEASTTDTRQVSQEVDQVEEVEQDSIKSVRDVEPKNPKEGIKTGKKRASDVLNETKTEPKFEKSDDTKKVEDELSALFDEFNDKFGNNLNAGLDPQAIILSGKIIAKGAELGFKVFRDYVNFVIKAKGSDFLKSIFPNFKVAYTSYAMQDENNEEDLNAIKKSKVEDYVEDTQEPIKISSDELNSMTPEQALDMLEKVASESIKRLIPDAREAQKEYRELVSQIKGKPEGIPTIFPYRILSNYVVRANKDSDEQRVKELESQISKWNMFYRRTDVDGLIKELNAKYDAKEQKAQDAIKEAEQRKNNRDQVTKDNQKLIERFPLTEWNTVTTMLQDGYSPEMIQEVEKLRNAFEKVDSRKYDLSRIKRIYENNGKSIKGVISAIDNQSLDFFSSDKADQLKQELTSSNNSEYGSFAIPEQFNTAKVQSALNRMYNKIDNAGFQDVNYDDEMRLVSETAKKHGFRTYWDRDESGNERLKYVEESTLNDHGNLLLEKLDFNPEQFISLKNKEKVDELLSVLPEGIYPDQYLKTLVIHVEERIRPKKASDILKDSLNSKNSIKGVKNVSNTTGNGQRDSQNATPSDNSNGETILNDRGSGERLGNERKSQTNESGNREQSGRSGNKRIASIDGASSNLDLFGQDQTEPITQSTTGDTNTSGSGSTNGSRNDANQRTSTTSGTVANTSFQDLVKENREKQKKAESIKQTKLMDEANIRETLPFLLPEQQDDVLKAETRFFSDEQQTKERAYGKGMLFTNGTGTGKTYTGLGIIKRFARQGKNNILIVVPSQPKVSDWIDSGKDLLLDITALNDTKDMGKGIVITTYANFRSNNELLNRDFDLIIYDESHRLMESNRGEVSATTTAHFKMSNTSVFYALQRLKDVHPLWIKQRELLDALRDEGVSRNSLDTMQQVYDASVDREKAIDEELKKIEEEQKKVLPELEKRAQKAYKNTKAVFLSATPFKTQFNLRYANGLLFDWGDEETYESASRGMSRVDPESRFFLSNFGSKFEWKYHRLQERSDSDPDAIAMQEIAFANKLMEQGAMSGRAIESNRDYARYFPLIANENTDSINNAYNALYNYETEEKRERFKILRSLAQDIFHDYNYSVKMLEALRAYNAIPRVKEHIAIGRQVVVFHRRKQANVQPPFTHLIELGMMALDGLKSRLKNPEKVLTAEEKVKLKEDIDKLDSEMSDFTNDFQDVLNYESKINLDSAINQFASAFGDSIAFINGDVTKKGAKEKAIADFNDPNSNIDIIMVQEESGKEGISLHDTFGQKQRVLINLSLPISSITAIQVEGRTYRIGNETDAIFEYPILGLDFEIAHFGQNFNKKLSTTENLAMGDSARDLLTSFSQGVSGADVLTVHEVDGIGGKELDKRANDTRSQFDKAILYYKTNQKIRGNRNQRQGLDFFPTPEPLGQKMVEWLGLNTGEKALEPSAGRGAIAMWFPGSVRSTAIEPSFDLYSKLVASTKTDDVKHQTFEELNIINKYHGIAMNPPFGQGGALAIEHIKKAMKHLYLGGRIVAIVPDGGAFDKKLDKLMDSEDFNEFQLSGTIKLPRQTFEQAGTSVSTKVLIIDKIGTDKQQDNEFEFITRPMGESEIYGGNTIDDFFDNLRNVDVPERSAVKVKEDVEATSPTSVEEKPLLEIVDFEHSISGKQMFRVKHNAMLDKDTWKKLAFDIVKLYSGVWSKFAKGYLFDAKEDAEKFLAEANRIIGVNNQLDPEDNPAKPRFRKILDEDFAEEPKSKYGDETFEKLRKLQLNNILADYEKIGKTIQIAAEPIGETIKTNFQGWKRIIDNAEWYNDHNRSKGDLSYQGKTIPKGELKYYDYKPLDINDKIIVSDTELAKATRDSQSPFYEIGHLVIRDSSNRVVFTMSTSGFRNGISFIPSGDVILGFNTEIGVKNPNETYTINTIHNHPSGTPSPSRADILIANRINSFIESINQEANNPVYQTGNHIIHTNKEVVFFDNNGIQDVLVQDVVYDSVPDTGALTRIQYQDFFESLSEHLLKNNVFDKDSELLVLYLNNSLNVRGYDVIPYSYLNDSKELIESRLRSLSSNSIIIVADKDSWHKKTSEPIKQFFFYKALDSNAFLTEHNRFLNEDIPSVFQVEESKKHYTNPLKAPNGKPSKLTPQQWKQVRTPEFKAWFGDWENDPKNASKVVDENGEPLLVYHGSPEQFTVFDTNKIGKNATFNGKGFYFAPDKTVANEYADEGGETKAVFLNIKNPQEIFGIGNTSLSDDYDGAIVKASEANPAIIEFIATKPNQIKSATGNTGAFDPNNNDIRFQLIGEKGASNLDKAEESTHRLDNLAVARDMEKAGKDAKTIRMATGWERGADGKWRYEVGDGKLKVKGRKYSTLSDILENDKLFKAYPHLKNIDVAFDIDSENKNEGKYIPYQNRESEGLFDIQEEIVVEARDIKSGFSVLLHEIQHAIQYKEGFAIGGNPNTVSESLYKENKKAAFDRLIKQLEDKLPPVNERWVDEIHDPIEAEIEKLKDLKRNLSNVSVSYEAYLALAGEVEARNVQSRNNLTPEQRREKLLSETEDVAREEQIFIQEGQEVMRSFNAVRDTFLEYQRHLHNLTKGWENKPNVNFYTNVDEIISIYPELEYIRKQRVKAIYFDNQVHILMDKVTSRKDLEESFLHEVVGHFGLRGFFNTNLSKNPHTDEFNQFMDDIFLSILDNPFATKIAKNYFGKPVSDLTPGESRVLAEEYVAHLAEQDPASGIVDKAITLIRRVLRQVPGLKRLVKSWTDSEIRTLISMSKAWVMNKQGQLEPSTYLRMYALTQPDPVNNRNLQEKLKYLAKKYPDFQYRMSFNPFYAPNRARFKVSAWHGSPHSFDRFSTDKIGTGEGAQAFGWGLYFTDLESIGRYYAESLSVETRYFIDGESVYANDMYRYNAARLIADNGWDKAYKTMLDSYNERLELEKTGFNYGIPSKHIIKHVDAIRSLKNAKVEKKKSDKYLYKVTLHKGKTPEQYTWLEWDKPIPESVKNKIKDQLDKEYGKRKVIPDDLKNKFIEINTKRNKQPLTEAEEAFWNKNIDDFDASVSYDIRDELNKPLTGEYIYKNLFQGFEPGKFNSLFLLRAGIDGIKYPAESIASGTTSDNARGFNYVVFDENAIEIEETIRFRKDIPAQLGSVNEPPIIEYKRFDDTVRYWQDKMIDLKRLQETKKKQGAIITDNANPYLVEETHYGRVDAKRRDFWNKLAKPFINTMAEITEKTGLRYDDISEYLYAKYAPIRNEIIYTRNRDALELKIERNEQAISDMDAAIEGLQSDIIKANESGDTELAEMYQEQIDNFERRKSWRKGQITKLNKKIDGLNRSASGMSDDQAADIVSRMEEAVNDTDTLETLHKQAKAMTDFIAQTWFDGGLISEKRYEMMLDGNYYVPLRGFEEVIDNDETVFSGDMRALGRTSRAGDVIAYIFAMSDTAIIRAEKNRIMQAMVEFAKDNPDLRAYKVQNVWFVPTGEMDEETGKEIIEATTDRPDANLKAARDINWEEAQVHWRNTDPKKSIRAYYDGRPVIVTFNKPEIPNALSNIGVEKVPAFMRTAAKAMRFLRNTYTQYSPEFALRNFVRDSTEGFIHLTQDFDAATATAIVNPLRLQGIMRGMRQIIRDKNYKSEWAEWYKKFEDNGGRSGMWQLDSVAEHTKQLRKLAERSANKGVLDASAKTWRAFLDVVEDYNAIVENAVRVSTFRYLIEKKGYSEIQAASYSKNLTVNFNRKGNGSSWAGTLYLFFNAGVQGISRLIKPFKSNNPSTRRKAVLTPMIMAGSAFMMMELSRLIMGSGDDEEDYIDKQNPWLLTHNMILPNFISDDPNDFFRISLPYGYNTYWTVGVLANQLAHGVKDFGEVALSLADVAMGSFSPIGGLESEDPGVSFSKFVSPTLSDPILELTLNRNFADSPIYREQSRFARKLPKSEVYFESTNQLFVDIAKGLNRLGGGNEVEITPFPLLDVSPDVMEYMVGQVTGGTGQFFMKTVDFMQNIVEGEAFDGDRMNKIPFVSTFMGDTSPYADIRTFYERFDKVKERHDTWKNYIEIAPEKAGVYFNRHRDEIVDYLRTKSVLGMFRDARDIDEFVKRGQAAEESGQPLKDAAGKMINDFNRKKNRERKARSILD